MSIDLTHELARLLDGYRDGLLDQRDVQRLTTLLDDPELAAQAMASMTNDGLIAAALESEGQATAAWRMRLALDAESASFRHHFEERRSTTELAAHRRASSRSTWPRFAAAALILVTLGIAAWSTSNTWLPAPSARLSTAGAGTVVWTGEQSRPGRIGTVVHAGERVEQSGSGSTSIAFSDGTLLELSDGALAIERTEAGKRLVLMRGHIAAHVAKQVEGQPLIIATADTETVVIGTSFTLEIDPLANATRLAVEHGLVRYASLRSGQKADVAAGQTALVSSDGTLGVQPTGSPPAIADGGEKIRAFIDANCISCHGEKKQKGKFRIDTAPITIGSQDFEPIWGKALERIVSGEMPPKEEAKQPTQPERLQVAEWIAEQLKLAEAQRLATSEKVSLHKLTREEYANTMRDMLGAIYVPTDPGGLPEDASWHGFERIGPVLTVSPTHLERYLAAAEQVMDQVLPTGETRKEGVIRMGVMQLRGGPNDHDPEIVNHSRIDISPNSSSGMKQPHIVHIPRAGQYKITVGISGLRPPGGSAPHMSVYCMTLDRVWMAKDIDTAEDKPETVSVITALPAGDLAFAIYNAVPGPDPYDAGVLGNGNRPFFTLKRERCPSQRKLTDDNYVPLVPILLLDYISFEGPSVAKPAEVLITTGNRDTAHARQIITNFAERAFRRPLRATDMSSLAAIAERVLAAGAPFEQAVKDACIAVLCSQDFIYLIEGSAQKPRPTLDEWEIASRLSYFLWSSMPDAALLDGARTGRLKNPDGRLAEVRRMLKDAKSERFAADFPRQWLHLRDVGKFPPNKKIFPQYDEQLEISMREESMAFFREVLRSNLGLGEFINSDWTMVNASLASLYGIPGIVDAHMRKVALKPEDHRGGMLTQAAVLSQTSDGSRQKPINRGKWVLDAIYGKVPPPPPANAGDIPTTQASQPKATIRQKIEAHRSNEACAGCHSKLDPLGFAFDNYDGIGKWRTVEIGEGTGDNPGIDASGILPDGRRFADPASFKHLLMSDLDRFAEVFIEKMATYALRRPMGPNDREAIRAIAAKTKAAGYRLQDVIEALVQNDLFLKR